MNKATRVLASIVLALSSTAVLGDVTAKWTSISESTVREAREAPAAAQRGLAAAKDAMLAARNASKESGNGHGNGNGGSAANSQRHDAAIAVAAYAVLESLYPAQGETLASQLAISLSYIPETNAKAEGAALGRRVGTGIVRALNGR
jgi:hypothetical protein